MKAKAINTVEQAIGFLETQDLEAIQTDGGWIVHGASFANDDFELTCDCDTDLIDYARGQRDLLLKARGAADVDSHSELASHPSSSPVAAHRQFLPSAYNWRQGAQDRQDEEEAQ